ncbi:hypothetical protein EW145_g2747 [Phellinidium pouzarii]|uniref:Matrin-type domain-containing protein n=1 Tax=Phellinidium pouzarii TaxID=167371 RepID=A0A4V3XD55_9AGAM|nr:hypothetical protein EW145_g2747 [Phellinidium pouzarii]
MSEYWVSHKKYFCKYCAIYISDDAPSRRQHETGLRHKGNTERFVRNLYKQGERRKKDLEEEKREMARVEQAANAALAVDISLGHASGASSSRLSQPSPSAPSSKKPERPTSAWSNYSTAQSLGYTDPDEERLSLEMERRRAQGVVGAWETVAPPPPPLPGAETGTKVEEDSKEGIFSNSTPQKCEAASVLDDDDDDDGRRFKLRKRKVGAGLADIWDPGDISIKVKSKIEKDALPSSIKVNSEGAALSMSASSGDDKQTQHRPAGETPKWKPMGWKRAAVTQPNSQVEVKKETDEQERRPQNDDPPNKEELAPVLIESGIPTLRQPDDHFATQENAAVGAGTMDLETKERKIAVPLTPKPIGPVFRKRKIPIDDRGRR